MGGHVAGFNAHRLDNKIVRSLVLSVDVSKIKQRRD